jgi:predicted anti-sigma-YlaC factor YlaD
MAERGQHGPVVDTAHDRIEQALRETGRNHEASPHHWQAETWRRIDEAQRRRAARRRFAGWVLSVIAIVAVVALAVAGATALMVAYQLDRQYPAVHHSVRCGLIVDPMLAHECERHAKGDTSP